MKKITTDQLRKEFLDFFAANGHKIVHSDSLIPAGDPTVLFTSAGMNQFKRQFMGRDITFRRAATCQKCLRTDDLDKVGKTASHHTFFEMLGNFSFGDYFKEEAIKLAWKFLTEILKISKEKLWVSVYKDDEEAAIIWQKQIGIKQERIVRLSEKENFWPSEAPTKGPNGPCGPCSEIFFDRGKDTGCKKKNCNPSCSCGRFVEIWNLVFTQFNRVGENRLEPLPFKNIDTGMGLERMSSVLQDAQTNFNIDIFRPIFDSLKAEIKDKKSSIDKAWLNTSGKIIIDHIRAVVFAINDGIVPSNEERGYVVRKLIRRSVLQYRSIKVHEPSIYKLVSAVVEVMKNPYPDIIQRRENIASIVKKEEESFLKVLDTQLPLVEQKFKVIAKTKKSEQKDNVIAEAAFEFYDTFGVPYEILEEEAEKQKLKINKGFFEELLVLQRKRSQVQSSMKGDIFKESLDLGVKKTKFIGYEFLESESVLLKIIQNGKVVNEVKDSEVDFVLDATPFYAESGGQVTDTGTITKNGGSSADVLEVKKIDDVFVHRVKITSGVFNVNDKLKCLVDKERRFLIACNHSATHLLQSALRSVLGGHVRQAGSLVESGRLRFDFTHFSKLKEEELLQVEQIVNNYIWQDTPLMVNIKDFQSAKNEGALAFFGEKYQEEVRVVSIGDYSKELCGGTHLKSTGQIGIFKIISESAISQGIRRIEAITSKKAYWLLKQQEDVVSNIAELLKVSSDNIVGKIKSLTEELSNLQKKYNNITLEEFKKNLPMLIKQARQIDSFKVFAQKFDDISGSIIRTMADFALKEIGSGIVCFGCGYEKNVFIVLGVTKDLVTQGFNASVLIKDISTIVSGSGGGRPDFAQAGGTDYSKLEIALNKIFELAANSHKV